MSFVPPPMNLPREGMPWGRFIQDTLQTVLNTLQQVSSNASNSGKAVTGTMGLLSTQIVNLNANVQAAFNNLTVNPSTVNPGQFQPGVILTADNLGAGTMPATVTVPAASLSGTVTAAINSATVAGTNVNGTNVRASAGPTTNITATRVAGWLQSSDGLIGTASSSERYKTNIIAATTNPEALLALTVHYYNYRAEVAKRDDPTSPEYVGPDYKVHLEIGGIAEEFHAAGLWEFVVYQRNDDGTLVLDGSGEPIPDGLHYELLGLGVLMVAQHLNDKLTDLTNRVAKLDGGSTA